MRNQEQQANASTGATVGNGILPKSTNIRLSSDVSDQQHEVRELQVNDDARQTRTSSELFRRLMSMDTLQSMSVRNLMANNPVFRRKALSMTINIVSRTLTLGMNVVLVLISTAFCVSQLSEVHLKLYSECEPKTLEEIYHHSYMAGLQENGSVEINAETQWGWTKDACYTTRSFQENTDQLWYSNYYEHEWNIHIDYTVVLFGMTAFYASCVLVYNLVNLVRDIYHLKRNTLHTLSDQARDHLNGPEQETRAWTKFTNWLNDLVETENTRWVLRCVFLECVEFGVAVSCMWLYNGYNWNDPENKNDVYLAEKPQFIILFAAGLAANMIGSAILWMSYVAAPEMCHGLTFRTAFFFVEDLSDLFYTVFPAIVVFNDSFNANSDELLVLLGQFHVNDFMGFSTRFFFLATLCFKTHHLVYSAHFKLVNRYYSEFHLEEERANWIKEDDPRRDDKRCFLFIVSALYIAAGIVVLVLVSTHFTKAEAHCNSIREAIFIVDGVFTSDIYLELEQKTLLQTNPELFLWDQCLHQRCQCRVFVVDWDSLETSTEDLTDLDLSQIKILTATLENYIMLEKFQTKGGVDPNADFTFNQNMLRSIHMKAFQWPIGTLDVAAMQGNDFGDFMALWTELEYLEIPADCNFGEFQNFNQLVTLTYLRVKLLCGSQPEKYWALDSICACKNLQILSIGLQGVQKTIPHCFGDLLDLIVLDLSLSMSLREVPFSIFELPKLKRLDLFRGIISWDSLLNYNLPMDLDRDDTVGVQSWLRYHFSFNENANFYLQLNPICDEISSVESDKLRALLEKSCRYECSAGVANSFCTPQLIGDGICEPVCNVIGCNYDGGDWYVKYIFHHLTR